MVDRSNDLGNLDIDAISQQRHEIGARFWSELRRLTGNYMCLQPEKLPASEYRPHHTRLPASVAQI